MIDGYGAIHAYQIGGSVKTRMLHSGLLSVVGVRVLSVLVSSIRVPSEVVSAVEASCLDTMAMKGRHSDGPLLLAGPRMVGAKDGAIADISASGSVQCTDSGLFRHMCGYYMANTQDGDAQCTLFRGFHA